jgi:hypothetical protein
VFCNLELPIRIEPDHPEANPFACVFCGTHYRGIPIPELEDRFGGNVRPA